MISFNQNNAMVQDLGRMLVESISNNEWPHVRRIQVLLNEVVERAQAMMAELRIPSISSEEQASTNEQASPEKEQASPEDIDEWDGVYDA